MSLFASKPPTPPHRNKSENESQEEVLQKVQIPQQKAKKHMEIVGDGEEIEVEDGEDLSKSDLDVIYRRYDIRQYFIILTILA